MVEDNLGKLIPDDQKSNFFTQLELFLFSAAALVLRLAGMRLWDSFLFADIGGGRWFLEKS
jgi:hypothetical protein